MLCFDVGDEELTSYDPPDAFPVSPPPPPAPLRFRPSFRPSPSSRHYQPTDAGLGKWVEIGNSGMFRPEMLEPMGFPKDVRVHGWGLSLERPTMIR